MQQRVALVHDWLTNSAGSEQVLLALHELFPEAPIYTSLYRSELVPQFDKATVVPSYLQALPFLRGRHQIAIPLMPLAFESFDLKGFDVVISVGNGLSKGVVTHPGQLHLSYCNTPMRYLWRIGNDTRSEGWLRSRVSHAMRLWDVVSAERPDHYLANSKTVQGRIAKIYRRESEVVYPPVAIERFKLEEKKSGYLLSVGRLVSYKRIDLIVKACVMLKHPLKIAGTGPEEAALRSLAGGCPWIEFLGRVPDSELQELYGKAKAFVFAAEEDFGIVAVEAMATGTPVITFERGGGAESVQPGLSGMFFSKQTAECLAECIGRFNQSDYEPETIRKSAERFSKKRFQDHILAVVAQHAAEGRDAV